MAVQWQYVEMREFNSFHEHGIFADCVSSEVMPLAAVRNPHEALEGEEPPSRWRRKCVYKNDPSARRILHQSLEAGDAAAREYLFHRFLPQHKAVLFFTVFTFIFAIISIIIGGCSSCFVPNGILHVVAVIITLICSLFGDVMFFLASMRIDNRYVHGIVDVYQQRIGYAFYIHLSAAGVLFFAVIAAIIAAYFLLQTDYLENGCCHSKNDSLRTHLGPSLESYPPVVLAPCNQEFSFITSTSRPPPPTQPLTSAIKPNGRSATVVRMNLPPQTEHEEEEEEAGSETTDAEGENVPKAMTEIKCRWGRRSSYERSFPTSSKI
uniref:Uncharacterized protein n=1 Tax=Panagrolaimus sp. PS1159 TaxID=55785 RepID=A0AC35FIQ6_9BILA